MIGRIFSFLHWRHGSLWPLLKRQTTMNAVCLPLPDISGDQSNHCQANAGEILHQCLEPDSVTNQASVWVDGNDKGADNAVNDPHA